MGNISSKKAQYILLVGIDGSGKTSILYYLKNKNIDQVEPTNSQTPYEKIKHNGQKMIIWDLNCKENSRILWRHYFVGSDTVIFVIDSTNRERLDEAKEELIKLLNEPLLRDSTFLILCTKSDLVNQNPMTLQEIENQLNIDTIVPTPQNSQEANRKIKFFSISSKSGENINESLNWAIQQYKEREKREKLKK